MGKPPPDSSLLVAVPEPSKPWMPGFGSVEDVYGAVSDVVNKPGALSEWKYERDANDTSMSRRQCQAAFPAFYREIFRSQSVYSKLRIFEDDLDQVAMSDGRVRAGVHNGKVRELSLLGRHQLTRSTS